MTTRRVLEQSPVECVVFLLFTSSSRRVLVIGVNNITTVSAFHKTQKQKRLQCHFRINIKVVKSESTVALIRF